MSPTKAMFDFLNVYASDILAEAVSPDIVYTIAKPEESNGSIHFTKLKSRTTPNPACSGSAVNLDDHHE